MRFIFLFFSLNLGAQSADFLWVPRLPDVFETDSRGLAERIHNGYQTFKKGFQRLLTFESKEKVRTKLDLGESLQAPATKQLVASQQDDFLQLLFHHRFSNRDEYLTEKSRLDALLESGKQLTAKERFFLETLDAYSQIADLQPSNKVNLEQVDSAGYAVPILSLPAPNALMIAALAIAPSVELGGRTLSPEILDSFNESYPTQGNYRFVRLLIGSEESLVCKTTDSNLKDPFCLQLTQVNSDEEYLRNIVSYCEY
ncbi:MAG: hypothetical protein WCK49_09270, partial [Myxococcaceae bacterium]